MSKGNISKEKISVMEQERRQLEAEVQQLNSEKRREVEKQKELLKFIGQHLRIGNLQANSDFKKSFDGLLN